MIQSKLLSGYHQIQHYFLEIKDTEGDRKYINLIKNCISMEQVHSQNVVIAKGTKKYYQNCDAIITRKNTFIGVRTADCLPILFYNRNRNIIGAIHAGWKGLLAGIVDNTFLTMKKLGGLAKDTISVVGPHISFCCYKVPYNRIRQFNCSMGKIPKITKRQQNEWYLDLCRIAVSRMRKLGILKQNIEIMPYCTYCDNRFPSFRRDGMSNTRMWSLIGFTS